MCITEIVDGLDGWIHCLSILYVVCCIYLTTHASHRCLISSLMEHSACDGFLGMVRAFSISLFFFL